MLYMTDRAEIADAKELPSGRLVVSARVARGGNVQEYLGSEIGITDKRIVRVYRPQDEVFDKGSMSTFPHKLVTLGHPKGPAQFDRDAVGWIGDEALRDGDFVRIPMIVGHRKAIEAVQDGTRELSVGYLCELVMEDGVTPDGQPYDAKQTKIVVDHVAIVDAARGGPELRIGDWRSTDSQDPAQHSKGGQDMAELKKILVDGLTIETTEQGEQAIVKLKTQLGDAQARTQAIEDAHAATLASKDAEIAQRDAAIDALKAAQLSDADIQAKAVELAGVIATAKSIHDGDYSGKSAADIRRAVVQAKLGDAAIAGKPDAYVDARFDILAEDAAQDPVRKVLQNQDKKPGVSDPAAARARMIADFNTAHQTKQ